MTFNDCLDNTVFTINSNADVSITNSKFEENFAFGNGGVIWIESSSSAKLWIFNSSFSRNAAINGGVFGSTSGGLVEFDQCVFDSNFAVLGGVVYS